MARRAPWYRGWAPGALAPLACVACDARPSEAQLEAWRRAAVARNAAAVRAHARTHTSRDWELVVQGQTRDGAPTRLGWDALTALATTRIRTTSPYHGAAPVTFRGVALDALLDRVGVAPDVRELTLLAYDGYFVTVDLPDVRRHPALLAMWKNDAELARADGGPLLLAWPWSDHPALVRRYPEEFWVFYVTHALVGTEPARVTVGGRTFDEAALRALPRATASAPVGYRLRWPSGPVRLLGVRVRDVLAAAGVALPDGGSVRVLAKPLVYRAPGREIRLSAADVRGCDAMLVLRWGERAEPVPARMGGPVTLALPGRCAGAGGAWPVFVEGLEVVAP